MEDTIEKLKLAAEAYNEALECDVCESGEYAGLNPNEIISRIIFMIQGLGDKNAKEKN